MERTFIRSLTITAALCLALVVNEAQANIVIKVRALNPLESEETASIYYPLPREVTLSDIIEKKITFSLPKEEGEEVKTTFNVTYVEDQGCYYIVDDVQLGPREVVTLEVHVRDIWAIPPERLSLLREDVKEMIARAEQAAQGPEGEVVANPLDETALELKDEIYRQLDGILERQTDSTVLRVGVEKHMEAYNDNIEALGQLQADISMLRFLLEPPEEGEGGEEGVPGEKAVAPDEAAMEQPPDLEEAVEGAPVPVPGEPERDDAG